MLSELKKNPLFSSLFPSRQSATGLAGGLATNDNAVQAAMACSGDLLTNPPVAGGFLTLRWSLFLHGRVKATGLPRADPV